MPRPDTPGRPQRLHAESRHARGPCFTISLGAGGALRYGFEVDRPPPGDDHPPIAIDIHPDAEAWAEFAAALDRIDVWSWERDYGEPRPGEDAPRQSWSLEISWDGRTAQSRGAGAYPPSGGSPEPSAAYLDWCRAVRALVGGRPFA